MSRWRRRYGANPVHLLALLACFALAGYAAAQVTAAGPWLAIAFWFVGAAVAHDFLLYPFYALADVAFRGRARSGPRPAVSWRNHLRFPLAISGFLLLLWFPLILGLQEATYTAAAGQASPPYLERWLLVTGALVTGSALVYAYRLRRRQGDGR